MFLVREGREVAVTTAQHVAKAIRGAAAGSSGGVGTRTIRSAFVVRRSRHIPEMVPILRREWGPLPIYGE
jgi:hypothetical protein